MNELCSVVGILHLLVYRLSWYGLTSWEWEQLLWPSQLGFDGVLSPIRALSGSGKTHPAQFIYNQSSDQLETWLGVQTIRIGFAQCVSVLWTLYSFTHLLALTTWSQVTWRRTNFVTRNICAQQWEFRVGCTFRILIVHYVRYTLFIPFLVHTSWSHVKFIADRFRYVFERSKKRKTMPVSKHWLFSLKAKSTFSFIMVYISIFPLSPGAVPPVAEEMVQKARDL